MRFLVLLIAIHLFVTQSGYVVNVYHYLDYNMGFPMNGVLSCPGVDNLLVCEWHTARNMSVLHSFYQNDTEARLRHNGNIDIPNGNDTNNAPNNNNNVITVFAANVHEWVYDGHTQLNLCTFPANLTLADTEGGVGRCQLIILFPSLSFSRLAVYHAQALTLPVSLPYSLTHSLIHSFIHFLSPSPTHSFILSHSPRS